MAVEVCTSFHALGDGSTVCSTPPRHSSQRVAGPMKCAGVSPPLQLVRCRTCLSRRAARRPAAARVACVSGPQQDWGREREDTDTRAAMAHLERDLDMLRAFERQNEDGISSLASLLSAPALDPEMPAAVLTPEQRARVVKEKRNALDELDRQAALLEEELRAKQKALEALLTQLGSSPQQLAGGSDDALVEDRRVPAQAEDVAPQAGPSSMDEAPPAGADAAAAVTAAAAAAIASRAASLEAVVEAAVGVDVRLLRGATVVAAPVLSWHEDASSDSSAVPVEAAVEPGVELTPHAEWVHLQQAKLAGNAEHPEAPPPPAAEQTAAEPLTVTYVPDIVRLLATAGGDTGVMEDAAVSALDAPVCAAVSSDAAAAGVDADRDAPSADEASLAAVAATLLALDADEAAWRKAAVDEAIPAATAQALSRMEPAFAAAVLRQLSFEERCQLLARMPWQTRQDLATLADNQAVPPAVDSPAAPVDIQVAPPAPAAAVTVERVVEPAAATAIDAPLPPPPPPPVAQKRAAAAPSASKAEALPVPMPPRVAAVQPPPLSVPRSKQAASHKAPQVPIEQTQQRLELLQANGKRWLPFLVLKGLDVWMRLNGIVLV